MALRRKADREALPGVHQLYRLIQRGARIDAVCKAVVREPPVAQLRHDGQELWFCSQECQRRFLDGIVAGEP